MVREVSPQEDGIAEPAVPPPSGPATFKKGKIDWIANSTNVVLELPSNKINNGFFTISLTLSVKIRWSIIVVRKHRTVMRGGWGFY